MGNVLGGQVNPGPPINLFDQYAREPGSTGASFLNNIASNVMGTGPGGYGGLIGAPGYGGQLSPTGDQTINPSVYGSWSPQGNAGMSYNQNFLQSPNAGQMSPQWQQAASNMLQYGTQGGYPGQLIHGMAQYGGTGGPGNQALATMLQYGAPSQATGAPMQSMAQTGAAGSWGAPLQGFISGQNNPSMSYLAPFLQAKPYSSGWAPAGTGTTPKKQGGS